MEPNTSTEPAPEDTGGGAPLGHTKGRRAFRTVRRELSDEELASPATQRMLIDDIERLESENLRLSEFQDSFHTADKEAAVLKEKLKTVIARDVVYGVCLTVGAALIGLAPSLWNDTQPHGQGALVLGLILIVGGIGSKVVKL